MRKFLCWLLITNKSEVWYKGYCIRSDRYTGIQLLEELLVESHQVTAIVRQSDELKVARYIW